MNPEVIPDADDLSRHLYSPFMGKIGGDLVWDNVFMFPSKGNYCESFIWRKYVITIAGVHSLGCDKEFRDKAKGKNSTYIGALTGRVSEVRKLKSKGGAKFKVAHIPFEGIFHVHISFENGPNLEKSDKTELKILIRDKFSDRSGHKCQDAA